MREIKFRMWDGEQMGPVLYLRFDKPIMPPLVIMQFTGLYDKNGKEIYEGDIVEQFKGQKYSTIYKVMWINSQYHLGFYLADNLNLCKDRLEKLEVIGNIFENPELLEGE